MVFSMLVNSLYNIVDSFFVAQISEQAMTALSLVYPVQNMINAVAIGFGIGINARVSYHLGAGDKKMADTAATHGFFLSVIHGILMTVISIAVMPVFLQMYTQDETVIRMGLEYSTIVFLFSTVIAISLFFEKLFQAVGRMKVSMLALLVGCISNIILDPFLIWGIGFFPKLGIRGAALATGIGQVLTIAVYMVFYILKPIPVRVTPKALKTSKETDLSLYAIGVPAILNLALPSFLISFLNSVLAAYSDSYVVILGIYYKLQTFLYLPANGIIQGMRPLIGYNFGAREMKRVKKIFRLTLESSCVIMLSRSFFADSSIHALRFLSLLLRLLSFDFSLCILLAQAGQYFDIPELGTYSTPHTVQFLGFNAVHRFVGVICNSPTKPMNL